jgi:hypothetical protein
MRALRRSNKMHAHFLLRKVNANMLRKQIVLAAATGSLFLVAGTAQAVSIDTFVDDQTTTVVNGSTNNDVAPGSFVGTNRNVAVSTTGIGAQITSNINALFPGRLDMQNSPVSNGTVVITWTGIGTNDPANSDFTDGGQSTGLFLDIPAAIDNELTVEFTANGSSSFSRDFPDNSEGTDFFFPFASFSDPNVFTAVTSLVMTLSNNEGAAGEGWDAQVNLVETRPNPVPVPGTLALVGMGLIGVSARRRFAKK